MEYDIEIKDYANHEITLAYLYYEDKRKGLGEEFLSHLTTFFCKNTKVSKTFS